MENRNNKPKKQKTKNYLEYSKYVGNNQMTVELQTEKN